MPDDLYDLAGITPQAVANQPEAEPQFTVRQAAAALMKPHGDDAVCWATGYMVSAVQQGKPQLVRDMKNVLAAVIELSRQAQPGEAIH